MKTNPEHKDSSKNVTCPYGGKQAYMYESDAKRALKETKKHHSVPANLKVYLCPKCQFYHIGKDKYHGT